MEIIENNYKHGFTAGRRDIVCGHCDSKLRVSEDDVDCNGYITCPCCDTQIKLDFRDEDAPAPRRPTYPDDFYDFSNGVDIDNRKINNWIGEVLDELVGAKAGAYSSVLAGNTMVSAYRSEDDIEVYVSKGYSSEVCDLNGNVLV